MANNKVGQIIYNVQDYYNSGGYISSAKNGPLSSTVNSSSYTKEVTDANGTYTVPDWDAYKKDCYSITDSKSIINAIGENNPISKLGIQAPSGTKVHLNSGSTNGDEQIIMIGRTGMYELDENINITDIYFERPRNYILDEDATGKQLSLGKDGMKTAEETRENRINTLNGGTNPYVPGQTVIKDSKEYWNCYIKINDDFQKAYDTAKGQYNIGVTGIYKLPNQDNTDAEENYKELYNIIIDFEY